MALQISRTTTHGFTAPETYVRVSHFNGNKGAIYVHVEFYANKSAADSDIMQPYDTWGTELLVQNGATMKQMYAALKELDEFKDAKDV